MNRHMAKESGPESAMSSEPPLRPAGVGSIPIVGDLARSAAAQARWVQAMLEQNARLVASIPETMRSFNDAIERFNQTVGRLDHAVGRIEAASKTLTGPMERVATALDPKTLRELPDTLDTLRKETVPALRAAADTQKQVALLQSTVERVLTLAGDLPGAGVLRRFAAPRSGEGRAPRPTPGATGATTDQATEA